MTLPEIRTIAENPAVENFLSNATLIRATNGIGAPLAYELCSSIASKAPFFGLRTDAPNVELLTKADAINYRLARHILTGREIKVRSADILSHAFADEDDPRRLESFEPVEIAEHHLSLRRKSGTVLVFDGVEAMLGTRQSAKRVIALCAALVEAASESGHPIVVAMRAHEDDGAHFRPLLDLFDSHVLAFGDSTSGEWRVARSDFGPVGVGGSWISRDVYVGSTPSGGWVTANVIDPATCSTKHHYVAAPGARALVA